MEDYKYTINIKEIFRLLLSKIWLILAVTILGGVVAFGYSKLFLPLQYSSHISMYIQSYTHQGGQIDAYQNQNDISNSKQLINTYIEVLQDDAVMEDLGRRMVEEFGVEAVSEVFPVTDGTVSSSALRGTLSITSVTDTSALKVTATTTNAEYAAFICNCLSQIAKTYIDDAVGVGTINTIDTAKVYHNPVLPSFQKNTAIGAIIGFVLAVLAILVKEFLDNSVKDADMLVQKYSHPLIGEVFWHGDKKKEKKGQRDEESRMLLLDKTVPFYIQESYKTMRTNVVFSLSATQRNVLAISSADPNEGKSVTASNLAVSLAQVGHRVLLVDADMRKPVQHKTFGLKNKKGLSTVISRQDSLATCIQQNVQENLDILPAGPIPPNPAELLSSDMTRSLLEQASKQYTYVILDFPPVNVVGDVLTVRDMVSGILLVVRHRRTTFDDLDAVEKKLELAKIPLLGYVLNGIMMKKTGGYSYNKYYHYKTEYGDNAALAEQGQKEEQRHG